MEKKKELEWECRLYQMANGFMITVGDCDVKDAKCFVFDTYCDESRSKFFKFFSERICDMMNELDIENAKISIKVEHTKSL